MAPDTVLWLLFGLAFGSGFVLACSTIALWLAARRND